MKRSLFAATLLAVGVAFACKCQAGVFQPGEFVTYSQDNWGDNPATDPAAAILNNHFDFVYPGGAEVGIIGAGGFSMIFTSALAVRNYLPATGSSGPLDNDVQDPTTTSSGVFGGHVLALLFNVDFNDTGHLSGSSSTHFGDLILHDLSATPAFNGLSVRQFLVEANHALGGAPPPYTYEQIAGPTEDLTRAFQAGTPSAFAQQHLQLDDCPADIDNSGTVNANDLLAVITSWGPCPAPPATCPADIAPPGGNHVVDVNDLLSVITNWGVCP